MKARLLAGAALGMAWVAACCDLANPAAAAGYEPSRLPVGPLSTGAWLPAGLGTEIRLDPPDRQRLRDLDLTHIEWLQRAEREGQTAETLAMAFCSEAGLGLPVYYEPPGY